MLKIEVGSWRGSGSSKSIRIEASSTSWSSSSQERPSACWTISPILLTTSCWSLGVTAVAYLKYSTEY